MMPHPCDRSVYQYVHCVYCGKQGHIVCKTHPYLQGTGGGGKCAVCGSPHHSYFYCKDRFGSRNRNSSSDTFSRPKTTGPCFVCGEYV